jgi:hypothetical protein
MVTEVMQPEIKVDDTQLTLYRNDSMDFIAKAEAAQVETEDEYTNAAVLYNDIKKRLSDSEKIRLAITKPIDALKQYWMDRFAEPKSTSEKARDILHAKMAKFRAIQEQKKVEAERILREAAAKESAKLAAKADKQEAKGNTEKADDLRQQAQVTQAIIPEVQANIPKVAGFVVRKTWKFKVVNEALVPREYLCVDMDKIGKVVRATSGSIQIAGIQPYAEDSK